MSIIPGHCASAWEGRCSGMMNDSPREPGDRPVVVINRQVAAGDPGCAQYDSRRVERERWQSVIPGSVV